ncbi:MAG TPA: DUF1800 domain-containing protein [Vicinamibacterales bacterium]|nr:DUF1800 domain-containing protein [Vicinamibacterales bacterium]
MKPLGLVVGVAVLVATAPSLSGESSGGFDRKLSKDKQAVHVLNRLTYGPRSGDADDVRRLGVEKWIARQLHPEQIADVPALEAKLAPAASLQLTTRQIYEKYAAGGRVGAGIVALQVGQLYTMMVTPVPRDVMQKLSAASPAERRTILDGLAPDVRRRVLAAIPAAQLAGLADVQAEAAAARRELNPTLNDLLSPQQVREVRSGSEQEKTAVLSSLDPEMRKQVLRMLPNQTIPLSYKREYMALTQPQQLVTTELMENKLLRALYSQRQLEEVLVDFWLNHFNVFTGKGAVRMLLTSYERDAIRPHVLGRFRDMLLATARHPAMLFYLDNWQSQAPPENGAARGPGRGGFRRPGLNENYGRELMELHTLGVDGGYTQADVIAVARSFTGWTIVDPNRVGEFQFNPAMHDQKEKVVLGHTIPAGGGESDGLMVIDILSKHPSTARFISRKLAQRFVADNPPKALIDRMAETFRKTDGDLRAVMDTMLESREFMSEGAWRAKLKSPLELVVSSLRALNADVADTTALAQRIAELGQPLYGKQEPTGYPNTGETWASSAALLGRMNFATALTAGQIPGVTVDASPLAADRPGDAAARLVRVGFTPETITAIEKGSNGAPPAPLTLAALLIASPDFQRR